jgi:UDP-GlcNAc:undecaprenyl-phosphate GlcNAc-1-phosphate transferase
MYSVLILFTSSFVLCAAFTWMCRAVCLRINLVDRPDNRRKVHTKPVPRLGGVAIALSYTGALLGLTLIGTQGGQIIEGALPLAAQILPAALVMFLIGLVDDVISLTPWAKLAGQSAAAIIAFSEGLQVTNIGGLELTGWITLPVTVIWLLACANAFNLIDGMDGLAAGIGCFAALTTFVAALLLGNFPLALATIPLVGCLLGFLLFNFNPASIFLGDSGSLLIGFLLGCYGIVWGQKAATLFGLLAPLIALAIPLVDTGLAVIRRSLRDRPIFGADRGHIHHLLLDRGLSTRRVALMMYAVALVCAICSLLASTVRNLFAGVVVILFGLLIVAAIHYLRPTELEAVKRLLVRRTFQRVLDSEMNLRVFEDLLERAKSLEERWEIICKEASHRGFVRVEMNRRGEVLTRNLYRSFGDKVWKLRIPLGGLDYIDLEHDQSSAGLSLIGPFLDVLSRQMQFDESIVTRQAWKEQRAVATS